MQKWKLGLLPILSVCIYAAPSHSASFDCAKAGTWVEKTICSNSELSELDDELAAQYSAKMADAKDNEYDYTEYTCDEQLHWLIFQRNTCKDTACLIREYQERLGAKPKRLGEWGGGNDIKQDDLPNSRAFGTFAKFVRIAVYNPEAKDNHDIFDEINSVDILSVTNKPYLAVIDAQLTFDNAHICTITDQLATWSGNYWTIDSYELDEPAELRLYPATYQGKSQILVRDVNNNYRDLNCGMHGYFDGIILEKK